RAASGAARGSLRGGAAGPGGPAGLQSRPGRAAHGYVGSTPTPLRKTTGETAGFPRVPPSPCLLWAAGSTARIACLGWRSASAVTRAEPASPPRRKSLPDAPGGSAGRYLALLGNSADVALASRAGHPFFFSLPFDAPGLDTAGS